MTCLRFLSSVFALAICLPAVSSVPLTGGSDAEKADHRLESRRHEGIPSVAVDPKSGRLWCTWYGGITPNEDCNNYLVLSTSTDGGRTWKEVLHYDPDGAGRLRAFDCELWVAPDGTLRWFWTERRVLLRNEPTPDGKSSDAGWWAGHSDSAAIRTDRLMMMTLSADREPVAPFPVPVEVTRGVMMCKPIVAKNGDWVLPVSRWFEDNSAGLVFSSDGGRTFAWHGGADSPNPGRTFDEHCVVEMPNGGFKIWLRNNRSPMESTTADVGRTWSVTTNANFKGPATRIVVRRLKSGRILLVGHGAIDENPGRSKLTAFLSEDDGASWKGGLLLDERENSSYPDADEDPDGTIYVVWDNDRCVRREIRCARFTEADVLAGKMVKKNSETGLLVSVAPEGTYAVFNPLPAGSVTAHGKMAECVSAACSCDWLPSVVQRLMRKGDVSAGEALEAAIQDGEKLSPDAVNSLWMATPEGGLAAIAYAHCVVRAKTNAGETEIETQMDVPRKGDVTLRFIKGTGYFPVVTRMPSWCDNPRAGQFVKHARNWKPGMEIVIKRATFGAAQPHAYPEQCRKFPRYIAAVARKKQPKVVFLGDSITHHWRDTGRVQWEKYLDNDMYRPANLGVCGDRTSEVLWRIDDGCLDGYVANCVVLMIGTNNSGHFRQKPDDTAAGIKEILRRIHEKQPKAAIILCAIFPRGRKPTDSLRLLNEEVNSRIKAFVDGKMVKWLDIGDRLLTEDGELLPSVAPDFLHPAACGYETWFAALKPLLDGELLKAQNDSAVDPKFSNKKPNPPPKVDLNDYNWYEASDFGVEGQAWPDMYAPYARIPKYEEPKLPAGPKLKGKWAVGLNVRFVTDSDVVLIRSVAKNPFNGRYDAVGCGNLDVYRHIGLGKWRYHERRLWFEGNTNCAFAVWKPDEAGIVYLPQIGIVESFRIGVKKGCFLRRFAYESGITKPVVHYGTSITQGGAATRAGIMFTAVASRIADVPYANLGFSGNGWMEPELASMMARADASLYILDCGWNMRIFDAEEIRRRMMSFVRILHERRPNVPILLCEAAHTGVEPLWEPCTIRVTLDELNGTCRSAYEELRKQVPNLHYLVCEELLPDDGEAQDDFVHPNDYGMMCMGRAFATAIKSILALE